MSFMFKKRELLLFAQDRLAMALLITVIFGVIIILAITAFATHASDVQVPVRYSGYGLTNLYRDKWYTLLSFGAFGMLLLVTNGFLAMKLHAIRRGYCLSVLAISVFTVVVAVIVTQSVFRLANYSL